MPIVGGKSYPYTAAGKKAAAKAKTKKGSKKSAPKKTKGY